MSKFTFLTELNETTASKRAREQTQDRGETHERLKNARQSNQEHYQDEKEKQKELQKKRESDDPDERRLANLEERKYRLEQRIERLKQRIERKQDQNE